MVGFYIKPFVPERDLPELMHMELCAEDTEEISRISGGHVNNVFEVALRILGANGDIDENRLTLVVYAGRKRLCGIFGAEKFVQQDGSVLLIPFLLHDGFMSKKVPVMLHRTCKRMIGDQGELAGILGVQQDQPHHVCNYIWEGNKRNIAWLKRLGFEVSRHGPLPTFPGDKSILQFHKRRA